MHALINATYIQSEENRLDTPKHTEAEKDSHMARSTSQRLAALQRRYRALAAQLADVGYIAAGSITHRHTRCANSNCRCRADPP